VPKMLDIVAKMMKMGRKTKHFQHLTSLVLQQKYERRESFIMVFTYEFVIMRKKLYKIIINHLSFLSEQHVLGRDFLFDFEILRALQKISKF
jgi:hypothetical protein